MQSTRAKPCPQSAFSVNDLNASNEINAVRQWYAACTRPRHEKAVAGRLAHKQVETYLPLYKVIYRRNGRKIEYYLPLFPGYVLAHLPLNERLKVLEDPGVLRIVSFNGRPAAVPDSEVETLRRSLEIRRAEPYPHLSAGKQMRIARGPLEGLEGTIMRRKGRLRMIVSIDSIQSSITVELDTTDLAG